MLAFEVMRVMNDGGKTELATSSPSTFYSHVLAQQEAEMKSLADQLFLRWPVRAKCNKPTEWPKATDLGVCRES
jgi:hypothetical protein